MLQWNKYAFLSRNPLCREYALFWSSLDSDLTQKYFFSEIRFQTLLLEMSLADRFKNFYRGQLFIFCLRFFPQNFTPTDAHCCWQWASKNLSFLVIQVLSSLCNILQVSLNPPSSGFVCAGTLYPAIGYHPSIKSDMRQHLYFLRCFSIFSIKWAQKPYLFWFTRHMHFFMT